MFSLPSLRATRMIRKELVAVGGLHLGVLALAAWAARGGSMWPAVAAAAVVGAVVLCRRLRPGLAWASAFLVTGILVASAGEWHLHRLADAWPEKSAQAEEQVRARFSAGIDDLIAAGEAATERLAARWWDEGLPAGPTLPLDLRSAGVDALALFGPGGELMAWDGRHQGPFPPDARFGDEPHLYRESPLFGYLYVTRPLEGGRGTAVAAMLIRADLPPTLEPPGTDFADRFERSTGVALRIAREVRSADETWWEVRREGRLLFHAAAPPASEADARAARELAWVRVTALLLVPAWLLAFVGSRGMAGAAPLAGATLPLLLLILPLGRLTGGAGLFAPAHFLLPGPVGITLGDLLAVSAGMLLVMGFLPWRRVRGIPSWLTAAAGALLGAGVLRLLADGASRDFLAGPDAGWVAFQGGATFLLMVPFAAAVLLARGPRERGRDPLGIAAGLLAAVVLGGAWGMLVRADPSFPGWAGLLWALPLWALGGSFTTERGWLEEGARWISITVVAVSLVLPWAWATRTDARMTMAEERVERLGTRPDPFLEFLLQRAGHRAGELGDAGREPLEVLYRAWTDGGLAWEGVPMWITYWHPDDAPQEELRIGVGEQRPSVPPSFLEEARIVGDVLIRRYDLADAHYVAVAPLPGDDVVTFVVPPRRVLAGASPFGPLFSPARVEPDPITLIPLLPGEIPGPPDGIRWTPAPGGWLGETYLAFPDEVYHAHYDLTLPGPLLAVARATLLLVLSAVAISFLWAVGRALGVGWPGRFGSLGGTVGSFRGRVTLAMFVFFLVPSVLFGMLAYRTLASAAVRTAEALAERAVEDAAAWYQDVDGAVDVLAQRVGSDLLVYDGGELAAGSLRELVELGLYDGWLPPDIHQKMTEGEEIMTTATGALGGWDYVMAYHRVEGGRVLAAPAPLQAGAMALRQRDVADLLGFAVVAGALFSVLLALLVGRALTRPIRTLRVASERVGAGNMEVHLPVDRRDEFGTVFDAFNRMVDNLSSARRALLRSSRRTRAIMEEVATGVVALDSRGRVGLANARAEELLGVELALHRPLPGGDGGGTAKREGDDPRAVLADWVEAYFRDGLREATTELVLGDRRIRIRARRISRKGPPGGAVLSLEDVTDELRTERILAWGEMARQVAHEVKNPLTPIKLGVQHIRRAWEDDRPDFEAILGRNVDAILSEIDRLASISTSFSRFGAPGSADREPLEPVDVDAVARDVLDLYGAAEGPLALRWDAAGELPAVRSRPWELKEVLVNLLENARAAMPEGGEVRMEARPTDEAVELFVTDGGPGIPEEMLPRVFEPHFSTRSRGSGLGLAIVRRLVESWGGDVDVARTSADGTTVRIVLLRWDGSPPGGDGSARGS